MTSDNSPQPISPLRARMIEDMSVRGFKEDTRRDYVRNVRAFAAFTGRSPDTATAEELRLFQLHQTQSGLRPPGINSAVSALRFFFTVTLDRPDLARRLTVVPYPRRIPTVLSVEEVTLLLQAASPPKYKTAFATAYGAGLRVSEVVALKVGDVDSERMLLRVERGKGARTARRCCRRNCSNCCAPGGAKGGGRTCCCWAAGCFPAATRSNRCRPASSAGLSAPPPRPRRTIGRATRALCDAEAGILPSSADGSGSRRCGTISISRPRARTENAPQCELCGTLRSAERSATVVVMPSACARNSDPGAAQAGRPDLTASIITLRATSRISLRSSASVGSGGWPGTIWS